MVIFCLQHCNHKAFLMHIFFKLMVRARNGNILFTALQPQSIFNAYLFQINGDSL